MKKNKIKGKDLLLTLLYLPGVSGKYNEPIIGTTRLTKMIFLFEKEIYPIFSDLIDKESLPNFFAYNYGPFSKDLISDLDFFEKIGYVHIEETGEKMSDYELEEYSQYLDDINMISEDNGILELDDNIYLDGKNEIFNDSSSNTVYTKIDEEDLYSPDPYLKQEDTREEYKEIRYLLTRYGIDYVEESILERFTEGQRELLEQFKKKMTSLSLSVIISYVYNQYPDLAQKSLIKEQYLKK